MTNREYILKLLSDKYWIDDNGASYESLVGDCIACPYYSGDKIAMCVDKDGKEIDCTCFECKENWLNSEVSE